MAVLMMYIEIEKQDIVQVTVNDAADNTVKCHYFTAAVHTFLLRFCDILHANRNCKKLFCRVNNNFQVCYLFIITVIFMCVYLSDLSKYLKYPCFVVYIRADISAEVS